MSASAMNVAVSDLKLSIAPSHLQKSTVLQAPKIPLATRLAAREPHNNGSKSITQLTSAPQRHPTSAPAAHTSGYQEPHDTKL